MGVDHAVLFRLATSDALERAVKAVPGAETTAWRAASRYVAGRSREEALRTATGLVDRGHGVSVHLFGELGRDPATADRVVTDYQSLATALQASADAWASVDLTHLALDADPAKAADRVATIVQALPNGRRMQVGAEDAAAPMRYWAAYSPSPAVG
jgi:proline dehydrogenase